MTRVAIIDAGSTVFALRVMIDTMTIPELEEGSFALVDIDAPRRRSPTSRGSGRRCPPDASKGMIQ